MKELNVEELRAFLAGDDTHLMANDLEWGYFDGKVLADPPRGRKHSEIVDERLMIRSRQSEVAGFSLAELSCVAPVTVRKPWQGRWLQFTWIVGTDGSPVAEVPWGGTVEKQSVQAGLPIRRPTPISKAAFRALRPGRRLT